MANLITCPDCGSTTPEGVEEINGNIITYVCHTGICDCRFDVRGSQAQLAEARFDLLVQRVVIGAYICFAVALYVGLPIGLMVWLGRSLGRWLA